MGPSCNGSWAVAQDLPDGFSAQDKQGSITLMDRAPTSDQMPLLETSLVPLVLVFCLSWQSHALKRPLRRELQSNSNFSGAVVIVVH